MQSSSFPFEEVEELTERGAEAAVEFGEQIGFYNLTHLSVSVATILARHRGEIRFFALEGLEPAVARALMKHEGFLDIRRMKSLNVDSARLLLQQMRGRGIIQIPYVQELHVEEAAVLSEYGGELQLHGLRSISEEVAGVLSRLPGSLLLGKDVNIDVRIARHISKVGCGLMLCCPTLSDEVIHELAKPSYDLSLDGLTSLSLNAATSLSNHEGELFLDSLTSLTEEIAILLSKHRGSVFLTGMNNSFALSEATKDALLNNPKFVLPNSWGVTNDSDVS